MRRFVPGRVAAHAVVSYVSRVPETWTRRRLGWPGLAVLVLALSAALVWLVLTEESAESDDVLPRGPYIGALPDVRPASSDGGAPLPPAEVARPRAADPTGQDAVYDPHLRASEAHFPSVGDGGVAAPFVAMVHVARVEQTDGAPAVGTACEVRVLPVHQGEFNCVVRVLCAGEVIYPNPSQSRGYLACVVGDGAVRSASDLEESDGDPRLELDVEGGRAAVEREGRRVVVTW